MTKRRLTQHQLLARAGWLQELLPKGMIIEMNNIEGTYAIFLKDGKGGMSEIGFAHSSSCAYQMFRMAYEILWLIKDERQRKRDLKKEARLKK